MKYLLLIALLVVAYLVWRNGRNGRIARDATPPGGAARPGIPQEMVRCAHCGLHLPRSESVAGGNGLPYCSQEHRLLSGG